MIFLFFFFNRCQSYRALYRQESLSFLDSFSFADPTLSIRDARACITLLRFNARLSPSRKIPRDNTVTRIDAIDWLIGATLSSFPLFTACKRATRVAIPMARSSDIAKSTKTRPIFDRFSTDFRPIFDRFSTDFQTTNNAGWQHFSFNFKCELSMHRRCIDIRKLTYVKHCKKKFAWKLMNRYCKFLCANRFSNFKRAYQYYNFWVTACEKKKKKTKMPTATEAYT